MPIPILKDHELEALTRICTAGMEQAATALSQLMGRPVQVEVPRVSILAPRQAAELLDHRQVVGLELQILGKLRGAILILLGEEHARRVLELLLGQAPESGAPFSDLEESTLNEIGNILASACLNALGTRLDMTLLPSVPRLRRDPAASVLAQALDTQSAANAVILTIDTRFSIAEVPCSGSIFLVPAAGSLQLLLASLSAP